MKYWDASALVPLVVREAGTDERRQQLKEDRTIVTWWGTRVECASAVARLQREGALDEPAARTALRRLGTLARSWVEVQPSRGLRETALRLLRVHPLRAADALHLAAAIAASRGEPSSLYFLSGDERLSAAAEKEGFAPE